MKQENKAVEFHLDFTYENEENPALSQVKGETETGKCIVLCGGSGCGKTTLLRCLNQLIPQFYEGKLKGFCRIGGKDLEGLSMGETGRLAASVFQDPRSQFFTLNSSTEVAFGLENFGVSREEMTERVDGAFEIFGLSYLKNRDVFALSSGERQLIAILAAWAVDTEVLLLDEPTANLDCGAINRLGALLKKLKDQGKTMIISEHRLYYLAGLADEYWVMEQGEIRRKLTASQMEGLSRSERERMGLRASGLDAVRNEEKAELIKNGFTFRAENLRFFYDRKGKPVLDGFSFRAHQGEAVGIAGANGCGKTSFGKLAAGLLTPEAGSFYLDGQKLTRKQLQQQCIFIMQEAEFQFFTNSVWNEVSYGLDASEEKQKEAEELLKAVDLWKCRNQHPFTLSGGQMQKLVLLLACLSPKPVVVLDEPTAGLDERSLVSCAALIRRMQKTKLVLMITHDLELMAQVCTRCVTIRDGKVENHFDLTEPEDFCRLRAYLETGMEIPDRPQMRQESVSRLDPRTRMLIFLFAMVAGIGTAFPLILTVYLTVMLVFLVEGKWTALLAGLAVMGGIEGLYSLFPGVITGFLISFFPRMAVIVFAAMMLTGRQEASRTLAALRALRVPEKVIMVFSVVLRFFPVLQKDLGLMHQSIATRGFFPRLTDKLRAIPRYLEMIVVPMVFRVIRIAEALSASAETRGIDLKTKRQSYLGLSMQFQDYCMMGFAIMMFAAGLMISY